MMPCMKHKTNNSSHMYWELSDTVLVNGWITECLAESMLLMKFEQKNGYFIQVQVGEGFCSLGGYVTEEAKEHAAVPYGVVLFLSDSFLIRGTILLYIRFLQPLSSGHVAVLVSTFPVYVVECGHHELTAYPQGGACVTWAGKERR